MRIAHPPNGRKLLVRNYSVEEHFRLMGFKNELKSFKIETQRNNRKVHFILQWELGYEDKDRNSQLRNPHIETQKLN